MRWPRTKKDNDSHCLVINSYKKTKKEKIFMKNFKLFFVLALFACTISVKAARHIIVLPVSNYHDYCQIPGQLDTFVVYKIPGTTTPIWRVNDVYMSMGDSIVFVPTSVMQYIVTSSVSGNNNSVVLRLFSAPPAHAVFTAGITGVASVNHDTVFMCGSSVTVSSNTSGSESTSYIWTGPNGFNSTNALLTTSIPGPYVFTQNNPCGITSDTVIVIQRPTTIPTLGSDTTFCNQLVNLSLNPGPGWYYSWNTGDLSQTIHVVTQGTYSVTLYNECHVTPVTVSINVYKEVYPLPNLDQYLPSDYHCADTTIILDPSPGFTYDNYLWNNMSTLSTLSVNGLVNGTGDYWVTITQGTQGVCKAHAPCHLSFFIPPVTPEICVVTVDETLNKNMVVWSSDLEQGQENRSPVVSYNIYKAIGFNDWSLLGNVPVTQEHIFVDQSSNPPMQSSVYKLTLLDECGIESAKSFYHKTILLSTTQGLNPGQVPLLWTAYTDEAGTFQVDKYYLYKGPSMSSLVLYDSIPGYSTSFVDTGVYVSTYYQIAVVKSTPCVSTPLGKKSSKNTVSGSYSNVARNTNVGIYDYQKPNISIYPNPSTGIFQVEGDGVDEITVTDSYGKVIIKTKSKFIDLSLFAKGIYYAKILTNKGSANQKLIVK